MVSTVTRVMVFGTCGLLLGCKLMMQSLPHIWYEVKTLQAWVNTAFMSMFVLFTYPFSILTILIQIVFVPVRTLGNPEKLEASKWLYQVIVGYTWLFATSTVLALILFGTTID